jgi:hypothetical protein
MTDEGAAVLPGPEGAAVPLRPRGAYVGFRAFARGGDAVLLAPGTARQLRSAAEFAARDGRVAGGLLYGTAGSDDQGKYLVISGYLEAPPAEDPAQPAPASPDEFVLSQDDLRGLRADAARMYPAVAEVGWWRSLGELGDFGPGDYLTQRELVAPGGVGLLVYGSSAHWGTAYLGPDGDAPELAGTLVAADETPPDDVIPDDVIGDDAPAGPGWAEPGPGWSPAEAADQPADPPTMPRPAAGPPTEPIPDPAEPGPGTAVATRPPGMLSPMPRPAGPRTISPVRVPARDWGSNKEENPGYVGPETPLDVKLVVGGLIVAFLVIAVIIGMLVSNALIAVIVAVVFLLVVFGFVWMSRL